MAHHIVFLLWCHGLLHERAHVETLQREVDRSAHFASALVVRCAKPFEMDNERVRRSGDGNLLDCLAVLLASWTPPELVSCQTFGRTVRPQTVSHVAGLIARDLETQAPKSFVCCACETTRLTTQL